MTITRNQLDIENPPAQTQTASIPVAPMSRQHQLEVNAINIFRIATWSLIFLNYDKDKKSSYLEIFSLLIAWSAFVLIIKFFDYSKHRSEPLKKELKKNLEGYVYELNKKNPFAFTQSVSIDPQDFDKSSSKVDVIVGQETLYHHAIELKTALNKAGIPFSLPSKFSLFRQVLPHWEIDFVSKGRVLEYFMFPGYLAGKSLGAAFCLSSPYGNVLAYAYSGITFVMTVRESFILNENSFKKHLEGFSFKDSSFFGWPPTCLGMQLKRKILFYPINSDFKATTKAIERGEKLARIFLSDPYANESKKEVLRQIRFLVKPGERYHFFFSDDKSSETDLDQLEAQSLSLTEETVKVSKRQPF